MTMIAPMMMMLMMVMVMVVVVVVVVLMMKMKMKMIANSRSNDCKVRNSGRQQRLEHGKDKSLQPSKPTRIEDVPFR